MTQLFKKRLRFLPMLPVIMIGYGLLCFENHAFAVTNCAQKGYLPYVMKQGDSCESLAGTPFLGFKTPNDVQVINNPISGFKCPGTTGQTICYRAKMRSRSVEPKKYFNDLTNEDQEPRE